MPVQVLMQPLEGLQRDQESAAVGPPSGKVGAWGEGGGAALGGEEASSSPPPRPGGRGARLDLLPLCPPPQSYPSDSAVEDSPLYKEDSFRMYCMKASRGAWGAEGRVRCLRCLLLLFSKTQPTSILDVLTCARGPLAAAAGAALLQALRPRLDHLPLCPPRREGQAEGPARLHLHGRGVPGDEEGRQKKTRRRGKSAGSLLLTWPYPRPSSEARPAPMPPLACPPRRTCSARGATRAPTPTTSLSTGCTPAGVCGREAEGAAPGPTHTHTHTGPRAKLPACLRAHRGEAVAHLLGTTGWGWGT